MLSYQVVDPYPSRIDGKINGFAWGLEVNNGVRERERELLLYFGHSEVRKKRAGYRWGGREKVYIPPSPQRSLKSQITIGEERERYIYPQPSMDTAPTGSGETKPAASRSGEAEPVASRSGETKPTTKGSGETEPVASRSGETKPAASRSGETEPATLGLGETF